MHISPSPENTVNFNPEFHIKREASQSVVNETIAR